MDIEKLRLILETIQGVGGDTKEILIWYFISASLPQVINSLLVFIAVIFISYSIRNLVSLGVTCDMQRVASLVDYKPRLDVEWNATDVDKTIAKVRELTNKAGIDA